MSLADPDRLCVTTLRMLAVDAVEQANSGHPGLPLGAAPMAYVLWRRFLRQNPANPQWDNRDRFVLSAGHGSALLYALLHLSGFDLPLDELRAFRQWGSKTPGHPEFGHTPGVEATTGPLGQGFAMAVGMALAERRLAQRYNHPDLPLVGHYTYTLVSDGDLMEGVSGEAASLAGHWRLGKLIALYDDNHISIEGGTELAFTEDVGARFAAYGWQVLRVADGEDLAAITAAIEAARADGQRPSLVMVRTHIGFGSPKADTASVHGSPLKGEEMAATRRYFGWPENRFHLPAEAVGHMQQYLREQGARWEAEWRQVWEQYARRLPKEAEEYRIRMSGGLPEGWAKGLDHLTFEDGPVATRVASGQALNAIAPYLPALIGGSADLAPSNNTWMFDDPARNLQFGVREHAMGAICNGLALHGGFIPFCGTFLVFADYLRPAIRQSAIMHRQVIYVLTHDSIAVGEDGPTHQPIEQVASLRAIPDLVVLRPADAHETSAAWFLAVALKRPVALILSRQNLPLIATADPAGVARGGYIVRDCGVTPDIILIASGSEVHLALKAQEQLCYEGAQAQVVSMPSWELFEEQPRSYQDQVLLPNVPIRLAIEAGASIGWERWVGPSGGIIAIDRFGASAPGERVMRACGLTVENIVFQAIRLLRHLETPA